MLQQKEIAAFYKKSCLSSLLYMIGRNFECREFLKLIFGAEDENEQSDVTEKMNQSHVKEIESSQSEDSSQDTTENDPMKTSNVDSEKNVTPPSTIKEKTIEDGEVDKTEGNANKPNVVINGEMFPGKQEVMKRLCFPSDLLTLRQVDEAEFLQTGIPWSIIALIPVPKGSTAGPYLGESVALSLIKPGELVLQFQAGDGDFSFVKVTEDNGAWLSLLRPANHTASHNTCIYFEGGHIWCEIVEDLSKGTELKASFITTQNGLPSIIGNKECNSKTEAASRDVKGSIPTAVKKQDFKGVNQISPQPALIYGCPFCGVRFSSRRTLEAHLTYYCSKKPQDFVSLHDLQQRLQQQAQALLDKQSMLHNMTDNANATSPSLKVEQMSPKRLKCSSEHNTSSSPDNEQLNKDTPRTKSPRTGEMYKYTKCNYATDNVTNYLQHKKIHNGVQSDSPTCDRERTSVSPACQEKMLCQACKIQFSSMSAYKGHKEFYCHSRLSRDENMTKSATTASKTVPNDLTAKMLTSPAKGIEGMIPLLSHQGHFNTSLLLSPYQTSPLSFDFLLKSHQQGQFKKSLATVTSATNDCLSSSENVPKNVAAYYDQPLDLSKSKTNSDDDKNKRTNVDLFENCKTSVKSEHEIPTKQLSPLAKKIKLADKSPDVSPLVSETKLNIPLVHPPLLLGNQLHYVNKKPVTPLQTVSRCVECNIVFYKYENYLIHKEHYCSSRQTGKDLMSDHVENEQKEIEQVHNTKIEVVDEHSGNSESDTAKQKIIENVETVEEAKVSDIVNKLVFKYYCIPCKIKFSSAGTLKAHKDFYCPHGKENEIVSIKDREEQNGSESSPENTIYLCNHCKNEFSSVQLLKLHICIEEVSMTPLLQLLQCLYCDYVTQSENRLSEHVKVHVPTKTFKCNLCGYRGNTARGMRMHGKMHLENGEEFTDENMIEFEEPPVVPIQRNGLCEKGPVDMETELIRLKNEPYKRRRSRKSFEKSEDIVPILGHICAACGQTFGNVNDFVIHLRMHEIAALEAMKSLKSLSCEHCNEFIAESLTALFIHMQTKHLEQLPGNGKNQKEQGSSEDERSSSRDSHMSDNRSRSNSCESSKTDCSNSSHDYTLDAKCSVKTTNLAPSYLQITPNLAQDRNDHELDFKSNRKKSKVYEICTENITNDQTAENITKQTSHDLEVRRTKSQHYNKMSSAMEDSRSNNAGKQPSSSGSPNHNLSPKSCYLSPHRESVCSPQQQTSPLVHFKAEPKSPTAKEQSHFSPERDKSMSPGDVRQTDSRLEKFSPKRRSPDSKMCYLLSQNSSNIQHGCLSPPKSDIPKKSSPLSPRTQVTSPKVPINIGTHSRKFHNFPLLFSPQGILSPYQFPHGISFIPSQPIQDSAPSFVSFPVKNSRKYCKHCDINFTYLSSFLTHKKYYCSARNNNESENRTASA